MTLWAADTCNPAEIINRFSRSFHFEECLELGLDQGWDDCPKSKLGCVAVVEQVTGFPMPARDKILISPCVPVLHRVSFNLARFMAFFHAKSNFSSSSGITSSRFQSSLFIRALVSHLVFNRSAFDNFSSLS